MLTNVIEVRRRPLSEIPAQLIASAGRTGPVSAYHISRYRIGQRATLLERREPADVLTDQSYEQAAVLGEPLKLRPSKGLHSLFPIDRAKLARLKGLEHS